MIAIPNMELSKLCHECIAFRYEQGDYEPNVYCEITKKELFDAKAIPTDCPLIDIVTCGECKHRDPEDKKCDCGMFERQGCIFPVADDYFCKYGERRE